MRVLVVEDESVVALDISLSLERSGHRIVGQTGFGESVLDLVRENEPDVVLMDVRLAGAIDGVESARQLRERFDLPIVFLTAYADETTLERLRPHASAVLVKPFGDRELPAALQVAVERHRSLREARRRGRELKVTLESIAEAVAVTDATGEVTYLNPAAETLSGWTTAEALGRRVAEVFVLEDDGGNPLADPAVRALEEGRPVRIPPNSQLRRRDGRVVPVSDSASPLVDVEESYGSVVVLRDETELVEANRKLARQERLVALGRLVATVAHEIGSPLTYALHNCEEVAEELAADETSLRQVEWQGMLADAIHGLHTIKRVVEGMRDLGSFRQPARDSVQLSDCVRRTVEMVNLARSPAGRPTLDLDDRVVVTGNVSRLVQLVRNLVANAIDACAGRADQVTVTVRQEGDAGVLQVDDLGGGIDPGALAHIFDPFFTTKDVGQGMGLGLAVVHQIAQEHEAEIDVRSEPGRGSSFAVRFASSPEEAPSPSPLPEARRDRLRVLLVDDDPRVCRSLGRLLMSHHQVVTAQSVDDALRALESPEPFDAIISDLRMPGRTGRDLLEEIACHHPDYVERVAFMTGGALDDDVSGDSTMGRPLLRKPFGREALLDLIEELTDAG